MERTTIMAPRDVLARLRGLARERGVSFSEVVREALAEKAGSTRPAPRSIGAFESGDPGLSERAGAGRTPAR